MCDEDLTDVEENSLEQIMCDLNDHYVDYVAKCLGSDLTINKKVTQDD